MELNSKQFLKRAWPAIVLRAQCFSIYNNVVYQTVNYLLFLYEIAVNFSLDFPPFRTDMLLRLLSILPVYPLGPLGSISWPQQFHLNDLSFFLSIAQSFIFVSCL